MDGSTDATAIVAGEMARLYPQVRVVHHPVNRGYGAAICRGFASTRKEIIFYMDGDAQYDPAGMHRLWADMRPGIDLVNGYKVSRSAASDCHRSHISPSSRRCSV